LISQSKSDDVKTQNRANKYLQLFDLKLKTIEFEIKKIEKLLFSFSDLTGWEKIKETDKYVMHYQKPLDMPTHSMRVEGTIDASILSILVIIYEVDLYKSWWPMILESKVIQEITIYKKYVYLTSWMPFPMQTRDVCLFGSGVDILENDTIVISVHSCEKDFNIAKDEADHDDKNKDEEKKDGGKEEEVNDHHNHLNTPEKNC